MESGGLNSTDRQSVGFVPSYASEIICFYDEFKWIFDFKMTHLFMNDVLKQIPDQWLKFGENYGWCPSILHSIAYAQEKDDWPESLRAFVRRCRRLRQWQHQVIEVADGSQLSTEFPVSQLRGVSAKKQHELERMLPLLRWLCTSTGCGLLIDVGAGLGHLAEVVRRTCPRLRVLALDRAAGLVRAGNLRLHCPQTSAGCAACLRLVQCSVGASEHDQQRLRHLAAESMDSTCCCPDRHATAPVTTSPTPADDRSLNALPAVPEGDATLPWKALSDAEAPGSSTELMAPNIGDQLSCASLAQGLFASPPPSCSTSRWCLTGLHTCGDLTPQLLQLSLQMPEVRSLLLLSCCYHRAAQPWRPLSAALSGLSLSPFALRLACQQSVVTWCQQSALDHQRHARAAGWRAMLDVVATRLGCNLRRRRRHPVHQYSSFAEYAADMLLPGDSVETSREPTELASPDQTSGVAGLSSCMNCEKKAKKLPTAPSSYNESHLKSDVVCMSDPVFAAVGASDFVWPAGWSETVADVERECQPLLPAVELLAALQACVQPVLEGALLMDRLLMARENALHAQLLPLFDQAVSPRAWAILAWKSV